MTGGRSFIDLLFILLLSTLVMLTQSVQLGAVETELLKVGDGGLSPIAADQTQIVIVHAERLVLDAAPVTTTEQLVARLAPTRTALLVVADRQVRHHRVMAVWSAIRDAGVDVRLGAAPRDADDQPPVDGDPTEPPEQP